MVFHYAAFVSLHFINKIKIFWKDMVYSWENAQVTVLFCHYIPNFILLGMALTLKHTYLNTTLYHLTNKKHINFFVPCPQQLVVIRKNSISVLWFNVALLDWSRPEINFCHTTTSIYPQKCVSKLEGLTSLFLQRTSSDMLTL